MLSKLAPWPENAQSSYLLAGIIGGLVATNYIEIFYVSDRLAKFDTGGSARSADIHNLAAVTVSEDCPSSVYTIIEFISSALQKILK